MKLHNNIKDTLVYLFKKLKNEGILVYAKTLRLHKSQGFMSNVFIVDSNLGRLVIHIAKINSEHQKNKVWEKFYGLKNLLAKHGEIKTAKFYFIDRVNNTLLLVQNFLPGRQAGRRIIKNNFFIDKWLVNKRAVNKLMQLVAAIHKVKVASAGWPQGKKFKGQYDSWPEYLNRNFTHWLKKISTADKKNNLENNIDIKLKVKRLLKQINKINFKENVLLHGDAINPGNILINKNEIYLLDWEWSIFGDPAWEFTDFGWWPFLNVVSLETYFKARNIKNGDDKKSFIKRISFYIPFWLLWGASMHANDPDPKIYFGLRRLLLSKLKLY